MNYIINCSLIDLFSCTLFITVANNLAQETTFILGVFCFKGIEDDNGNIRVESVDEWWKRVEDDEMWSLMCPNECKGLQDAFGDDFNQLYTGYEQKGKFKKQVRARDVWNAILDSQIETGTPYMLYKGIILFCN